MTDQAKTVDITLEVRVGRKYDIDIDSISLDELTDDEKNSFEQHILDAFDEVMENHDMGNYTELDEGVSVDIESAFHDLELRRYPKSHHEETETVYATLSIPSTFPITNDMLDEIAKEMAGFPGFGYYADWDKPQIDVPKGSTPFLLAAVLDKVKEVYETYHDIFTPYQMSVKLYEELEDLSLSLPQSIESSFENIFENSPINSVHKNIMYKVASTTMNSIVEQNEIEYEQQLTQEQPKDEHYHRAISPTL